MQTTFYVRTESLKCILDRLAPYVGDNDRPVLACIRLEAGKDGLTAVAADGFILGSQAVAYSDKPKWARGTRPPLTILVPPAQLKVAVGMLPKHSVATFTVTDSGWRVDGFGQAIHLTPQEGTFPDYSHCLPALKDMGRSRAPMAYMSRGLTRAVKGLGDERVFVWGSDPKTPTIIATADGFWAMLMPAIGSSTRTVETALAPGLSDGHRIVRKYRRQERQAKREREEEAARRLAEASETEKAA